MTLIAFSSWAKSELLVTSWLPHPASAQLNRNCNTSPLHGALWWFCCRVTAVENNHMCLVSHETEILAETLTYFRIDGVSVEKRVNSQKSYSIWHTMRFPFFSSTTERWVMSELDCRPTRWADETFIQKDAAHVARYRVFELMLPKLLSSFLTTKWAATDMTPVVVYQSQTPTNLYENFFFCSRLFDQLHIKHSNQQEKKQHLRLYLNFPVEYCWIRGISWISKQPVGLKTSVWVWAVTKKSSLHEASLNPRAVSV